MLGDYGGGWEDFEARWEGGEIPSAPRPFAMPAFTARDWGDGHRIALWAEQGLGDELLFSTLVPELETRGEDFVLEVDRRLALSFARAHPRWSIAARGESDLAFAGCDRHLALGSLPALLRPSPESFAAQPVALLRADGARASRFRELMHTDARAVIGISWRTFQSGARRYYELTKSAPLAAFRALGEAEDLRLLDLQYGDTAAQRAAFIRDGGSLERLDELDLYQDIDGVLAAISACDVVVTASNVTAHLAGSLGKRTLLVFAGAAPPFHYWVPDAAGHSRWYPSVEIVPGGEDGWPGALARARERLPRAARRSP
jgi:hypothetical protein